jgi:photosystem II stability/assembly factor-like uncharacterized protein
MTRGTPMKTKILLALVIILIPINLLAQTYGWMDLSDNINSEIGVAELLDVYFIGEEGWISSFNPYGADGEILHTTDGGLTFDIQTTMRANCSVFMVNNSVGYCGCVSGFVLKTIDGGNNWDLHGMTAGGYVTAISFPPNSDTGYCCCLNGYLCTITPSEVVVDTQITYDHLTSISFPTSEQGWSSGSNVIAHYINGSWIRDQSYTFGTQYSISMISNTMGWIGGSHILHTTDGYHWLPQAWPDTLNSAILEIFFINENEGWAVGDNGLIIHTTNGGETWLRQAEDLTEDFLNAMFAVSNTEIYAVGANGTFLKYGELTGIDDENKLPSKISLSQNYPNPFNAKTSIQFELVISSHVKLEVYNVLGEKVATVTATDYPAGNHAISFDASSYASGIYFYKLDTGDFTDTKKMLLIK